MCKRCNISRLDETKTVAYKDARVKVGKAVAPFWMKYLEATMRRDDDKRRWTLDLEWGLDYDLEEEIVDRMYIDIPIKYCPFCGDKLADRFDSE